MQTEKLTWAEIAVLGIVCCGCEYLRADGCHYEEIKGIPLPCQTGTQCYFNPHKPTDNRDKVKELRENAGSSKNTSTKIRKEKRAMRKKVEVNEAAALNQYHDGWSDAKIAEELGVSPMTISRWRKERGLLPHGRGPDAKTREQTEKQVFTTPGDAAEQLQARISDMTLEGPNIVVATMPTITGALAPSAPLDKLICLLHEMSAAHPGSDITIDGLPVKSVTVITTYDLDGNQLQPQINLLSE